MAKSSSCADSTAIKPFRSSGRRCRAAPSAAMRASCATTSSATSCGPRTIRTVAEPPHCLEACDEMGLLVLEEIPGWQHIGDESWKQISVDNVGRMIRRDWNHPSIILWGVRIHESRDNHDFYVKTNTLAHRLDTTRPTGGIRYFQES